MIITIFLFEYMQNFVWVIEVPNWICSHKWTKQRLYY